MKNPPAKIERGFQVGAGGKVPAIGEVAASTQEFCPLIQGACMKHRCMLWVELLDGNKNKVGHCSYYWNSIQMVDIKNTLIRLNANLERLTNAPA